MNKYNVSLIFSADWGVDVEANTPEEAAELAYNSDEASVSVCHQCAGSINLGDCIRVIVYDENSNEVFDDGSDKARIAKLKAQLSEVTRQRDEFAKDAERLNYLQQGATVDLVGKELLFRVGGIYATLRTSIREAIDAAIKGSQS